MCIYKFSISLILSFCTIIGLDAQTMNDNIDAPGDIAFVGYEHDATSGYAFVFIDNCPPGTIIIIDDEEWGGFANGWTSTSGEGANTWTNTTGGMIPKGTVIKVESGNNNPTATMGSVIESDSGFNLGSEDAIFAYVGTFRSTTVTFLAMVGDPDNPGLQTLDDTGLILGLHTFDIDNIVGDDEGIYTGPTECNGTAIECLQMINNSANWNGIGGGVSFPASVPDMFGGSVLPVELSDFESRVVQDEVHIRWKTETEINNDHFIIERSSDGFSFEEIKQVRGHGNSNSPQEYSVVDRLPKTGLYYYRLAQRDLDGTRSELRFFDAFYSSEAVQLSVYPNPFHSQLRLEVALQNGSNTIVQVFTDDGAMIFSEELEKDARIHDISTENWSSGVYTIRIIAGRTVLHRRVVKAE